MGLLAVAMLCGALPDAATADPFAAATVNVRAYFDTDGLPQNSVESMSLDRDGRLWITTRDGGAVFDGTTWVAVQMPDPRGSNWPREVLATSDGAVWFGVEPEGLHRLKDGEWLSWNSDDGLEGRVTGLVELDGLVIAGTTHGIYSLKLASPAPHVEFGPAEITALESGYGETIATTAGGDLARRRGANWVIDQSRRVEGDRPISLLIREHEVLVGTSSGIVTFDGGTSESTIGAAVTSIVETRLSNGSIEVWAATDGSGIFRLQDGGWTEAGSGIRLPNRYAFDLLPTPPEGPVVHLLVGTLSGIGRIDLAAWRRVGTAEGLPDASVVSVMESRSVLPGSYFLGTTGGLAVFGASGRWEAPSCTELRTVGVFSMLESTGRGALYFGTGNGIVEMDRSGCRRLPGLDGLPVVSMAETGSASTRLWAGTYGDGLWWLDEAGEWTRFEGGMPDQRIEALTVSRTSGETLWIATNTGLASLSGAMDRAVDHSSGLPHVLVRSLLIHDGELWVGTARGLAHARLDEPELNWEVIDLREDGRMTNDTVYRIESSGDGRIYAFTGRGIARLRRDEGTGRYSLGRVFLSDDGLPSSETNFGASTVDSSGRIWAGTPLGAGIFDPSIEVRGENATHRLVVRLETEPEGRVISDGDLLDAGADRIVASFRLIDLVHGHRAVYRTELSGLDDGPGDWTPASQRTFSRLPGGRFQFRVWARDPHGHEAGPSTITFSIQQPVWLSWWAVLVYVAGAVIMLYTFIGLRIRSLRRRNADLELVVRSRTRDLEVANRQLESANVTLADMSVTDPLTGAKNRRFLIQKMEHEAVRVRRSTRESDDVVFVLVDIDRFKYINDRFGHATGDHVLKQFHRVLTSAVRDSDTIVRWGGEEFLVVARRISRTEATVLAERILQMVRDTLFESTDSSRHLRLTCSIGFATFPFVSWDRGLFTWEQVVDIADHCLYAVKRSGRDGMVGLAAGPQLRSDSFLSRMRDDVGAMAAADEVTILTSFESPSELIWR